MDKKKLTDIIEFCAEIKNENNLYPTKEDIDKDIKSIIQDNGLINSQDNYPIKSNIDSRNNKNQDNNSKNVQTELNQNIIQDNAFIHFPTNSPIKNDSNSYINQNNDGSIKNIDADINPNIIQDNGIKKEDIDINLNKIQAMEVVSHKDNYDVNLNNIKDNSQKKINNEELNIIHINSPIKSNANMNSIQNNGYKQVINLKEDSNEKLKIIQSNIQNEYDDNYPDNYQSKNSFKEEVYDKSIPFSNDNEVNDININFNNIQKDFGKEEESFKNEYNDKKNILIKNEKNKKINYTQINSNIEEENSNNEETEITRDKKIELEIDHDSYEKFIIKNKFQYEENLSLDKEIKIIPKRLYRVYGIIQVKSKIKQLMSEFYIISKYQKELLNCYCSYQEISINNNLLKSIISRIEPPAILNIKRKFIDLITYWVIKKNCEQFEIDENYIPKNNYLDQISKILKKKINKDIQEKNKYLSNLKNKNASSKSYPIIIKDNTLEDLFSYLNFYKSKCTNVVHIGKEGFKYNNLDAFDKNGNMDVNNVFKEYESKIEKNLSVDIEFIFKFLFDSKYGYNSNDKVFKDKINKFNKEKIENYDSLYYSIMQDSNKMVKILEKSTNLPEFKLDDFEQEERTSIQKTLNNFNSQIVSLQELIRSLDKKEKLIPKYIKAIKEIDENLISLVKKECINEDNYYIELDQKVSGRFFLFYLQYKYMKIKSLYKLIEKVFKKYSNFLEKNKDNIEKMIANIKEESELLYNIISAENKIKSGKEIFLEWKKKNKFIYYLTFEELIKLLKKNFKNISSLKIDDDVINEEVNLCWLVKNELDDLVLN